MKFEDFMSLQKKIHETDISKILCNTKEHISPIMDTRKLVKVIKYINE